jgi:predicted dehydrogenase
MHEVHSRRQFLQAAIAAGTALPAGMSLLAAPQVQAENRSPNEKLNLAIIGVAARGGANLSGVSSENIAVLCDIDAQRLGKASEAYPRAKTYDDYRRVFDHKDLDGVVVSTPDHMHAIPVIQALKQGLAVYCEKPLAHSVHEVRQIRKATAAAKAVTQLGSQIHAGDNYRRVVEIIQAGTIGPVQRVHVWQGGGVPTGKRVTEGTPPDYVNYDLWLGPAPYRPFHESHFHFNWRYWWDFGGGQLADFWCHYADLAFWALDLKYPTSVVAQGEKGHDGDNDCPNYMQVDYEFPARGDRPPVHLTWYHGGWMPKGAEEYKQGSAVLFEGTDGRLIADYGTRKLFMEAGKEAKPVEPSIPNSIGHHKEWIEAVKTQGETTCNFEYGGTLTEAGLLGNVSYRAGKQKLEWDAENLKATNCPEADQFIQREYRKGWELPRV